MTDFDERVYALCRRIPRGKVTTYREIGDALGTRAYRAVGQALRRNPDAPRTPCHRVVAAGGKMGGFSAPRGVELKRKMLGIEAAFEC